MLRAKERAPTPCSSAILCLGLTFESFKEWECVKNKHSKEVVSTPSNVHCVNHVIPKINEQPARYKMFFVTKKEFQNVQSTSVWLLHQHQHDPSKFETIWMVDTH